MHGMLRVAIATTMIAAALPAMAKVTTVALGGTDYSTTPYTYDFGGGNTVTFSVVNPGFSFDPAGVSTGGNTQVLSLGAPFYTPPQPTSFFSNRGGSIGPSSLGQYLSYSTAAAIPFSISEGLVALRFDLGSGYQYGYADITESSLSGFRYETTPGKDVLLSAVPEPSSWALMIVGFGLVAGTQRFTRRVRATA